MSTKVEPIQRASFVKHPDILISVGVVAILMVMLLPLPRFLLDLLLSFNITLSVIILLVGLQVRRPIEFSVFPSILLMITLLRLSLNIASTRLILLHGNEGVGAAGGRQGRAAPSRAASARRGSRRPASPSRPSGDASRPAPSGSWSCPPRSAPPAR